MTKESIGTLTSFVIMAWRYDFLTVMAMMKVTDN